MTAPTGAISPEILSLRRSVNKEASVCWALATPSAVPAQAGSASALSGSPSEIQNLRLASHLPTPEPAF